MILCGSRMIIVIMVGSFSRFDFRYSIFVFRFFDPRFFDLVMFFFVFFVLFFSAKVVLLGN